MIVEETMQTILIGILLLGASTATALSQEKPAVDPARVDAAVKAAFPVLPPGWAPRLVPDETMRQCSAHRNAPPRPVVEAIQRRERRY